jgi:hypothetical protein
MEKLKTRLDLENLDFYYIKATIKMHGVYYVAKKKVKIGKEEKELVINSFSKRMLSRRILVHTLVSDILSQLSAFEALSAKEKKEFIEGYEAKSA